MVRHVNVLVLAWWSISTASTAEAQERGFDDPARRITFPNVPGYLTLKCDLHQHSVFSDGSVAKHERLLEGRRPCQGSFSVNLAPIAEDQSRRGTVSTRLTSALLLVLTAIPARSTHAQATRATRADRGECVLLLPLDAPTPYVTDPDECAVRTAPASTFKIPHALIALDTGVVSGPLERVAWDGKKQPFTTWERDHSLDSAMKSSVVWFFQRTAALIGRERMREHLTKLDYTVDSFEGDVTLFWLNGDLVVSPDEQLRFLRRLVRYELPVDRQIVDAVKAAFTMPLGEVTNAAGIHHFGLTWPGIHVLRAKTGYTRVGEERVSWILGHIESDSRQYVFVSRVRAREDLSATASIELALRVLNARGP